MTYVKLPKPLFMDTTVLVSVLLSVLLEKGFKETQGNKNITKISFL